MGKFLDCDHRHTKNRSPALVEHKWLMVMQGRDEKGMTFDKTALISEVINFAKHICQPSTCRAMRLNGHESFFFFFVGCEAPV